MTYSPSECGGCRHRRPHCQTLLQWSTLFETVCDDAHGQWTYVCTYACSGLCPADQAASVRAQQQAEFYTGGAAGKRPKHRVEIAAEAARVCCRMASLVEAMSEPAPKRARLGRDQSFVLQCTSVEANGDMWPPKLLQLISDGDKTNRVRCNGCPAHGNWMLYADCLTITFQFAGGPKVKTSHFK